MGNDAKSMMLFKWTMWILKKKFSIHFDLILVELSETDFFFFIFFFFKKKKSSKFVFISSKKDTNVVNKSRCINEISFNKWSDKKQANLIL